MSQEESLSELELPKQLDITSYIIQPSDVIEKINEIIDYLAALKQQNGGI